VAHGDGIGIESKSAAPDCTPCGRDTLGLLTRRHLALESVALIGKESNSYDEVEAGAIQDWDDVLNVYSARRCPVCGKPVTDKRAVYCSPRHRKSADRGRRKERH
jgi:hypothetical protein